MKLDILAFAAHPDDIELACSGTLIKHAKLGKKTGIVDLTQGELGTRGSAELRAIEAKKSAEIMGLEYRENLHLGDGYFEINETTLNKIIVEIRKTQPQIVLANAPSDRHPDHGRASELVKRACFLSGLPKVQTTYNGVNQSAHRPKNVYFYIQDHHIHPDFVIDITDEFEVKMETVKAFSSQFYDPNSKEPETPISTKNFFDFLDARFREFGRIAGVTYAEGFICERAPAVSTLYDLK